MRIERAKMPGESKIETINELKIWLEGRFDLLSAAQKASADEIARVRNVVHETSQHVQVLLSLNIPAKFETFTTNIKKHDEQIEGLIRDGIAKKSANATVRLFLLTVGGMLGTMATLIIQFWSTVHH